VNALLCLTTCPDLDTAQRIADALVEERLAACVNLLPGMQSTYRWQGKVEHAAEVLLLAKTTRVRMPALQERIVALHPYELPEVLAVEAGGLPAYLQWIARETDPSVPA
jgi:periplasmic divalent cation tolerance protein